MNRLVIAVALLVSNVAGADVWQDAIRGGPEASRELYDRHLREGDERVLMADSRQISRAEIVRQVNLAITSYKADAAARPTEGEPWFRIATTLSSFYLASCGEYQSPKSPLRDCPGLPGKINVPIAEQVVAAWQEFEKRAPLDPRLSPPADPRLADSPLFERAILHTKLGTEAHIAEAARLYEIAIRRSSNADASETIWSNLAETYMMLGRLEDSLEAYRQIRSTFDVSTKYGVAVVLDRAGRAEKALDLIRSEGREGYERFQQRVASGQTFFVPYDETFYYFGLAAEAFGEYSQAVEYFQMFLRSGAHPQFQARAREHVEALSKKRPRIVPPPDLYRDFR
jgi:tetratricopeptide (TPR) repeat protein